MKFGQGHILASAVVAVLPDTLIPDPNRCTVFTLGGHRFALNHSIDAVMQQFESECRPPYTFTWYKNGQPFKPEPDPEFLEVEGSPEEALQLLTWLDKRHDLILAYGEGKWRIHLETMDAKEPEWTCLFASGWDSPIEALRAAHKAFCDGR